MISEIKLSELNEAQLIVLQVIENIQREDDLKELRILLVEFKNRKMQDKLEKIVAEKGYTDKDFDDMLCGHSRKTQ